jgi:two-component system sensor histidine kinase BarA
LAAATHRFIPIVALTADVMEGQRQALLAQGLDDYQTKPIHESVLRQLIAKWAGASSQKDSVFFDIEEAKALCADNLALARELAHGLLLSLPAELQAMQKSYAAREFQNLKAQAHKLLGAACYTGTPELKNVLQKLEQAVKNQSDISDPWQDLLHIVQLTEAAIKKYFAQKP